MVKVNDSVVYVGPYGGDRLSVVERQACYISDSAGEQCFNYSEVQYGNNQFGSPELRTNWSFGLNVDLRPYLRDGANSIFMRTIVYGAGEGAIKIKTRQYCPVVCSTFWENRCTSQEARSGTKLGQP
jgi:hypothetical protein